MESLPVVAVLGIDLVLLRSVLLGRCANQNRAQSALVAALFFCSGFPALIYKIVWQRALFAIYGVNVQSVAVVVSAFMLGLGIGSLVGGWLSEKFPEHDYNATESPDVFITGLREFKYGLRVITFLMVSDSPLVPDKTRWFSVLRRY
jgi:MFS family permease